MIRILKESDLPIVIEIEHACHFQPWSSEIFQQCYKNCLSWVLEQDNTVIGFIICSMQLGECHILNIAVKPSEQKKGHGQALLNFALQKVKALGSGMAFLEVRKSNMHAIRMYEKSGFVEIGRRKDYYVSANGYEDAILLAKDLTI